ncbi:MAG: 50S ribosomal protein L25, partial [Actinobacteria bacterium]|nr:50S ribosomal protein L25 [Actinomycetota bacterium]
EEVVPVAAPAEGEAAAAPAEGEAAAAAAPAEEKK